jgi:hypothetical protein
VGRGGWGGGREGTRSHARACVAARLATLAAGDLATLSVGLDLLGRALAPVGDAPERP